MSTATPELPRLKLRYNDEIRAQLKDTLELDNIARIPQVRREVARIETLLREREITAAEQLEAQE